MSDTRTCPGCGGVRLNTDYYRDATRPNGLSRLCKECDRERQRKYWRDKYYPANRERLIEAVQRRRKEQAEQ